MDSFIGEIRVFAFNWAPQDWAMCDGSVMQINQAAALFSILSGRFGGNPQQGNFGLPNLKGTVPVGAGAGPGLTPRNVSDDWGENTVTLNSYEIAPHNHNVTAHVTSNFAATTPAPGNPAWLSRLVNTSTTPASVMQAYSKGASSAPDTTLSAATVGPTGGNQPHENRQPALVMNYCISLNGVYPVNPS